MQDRKTIRKTSNAILPPFIFLFWLLQGLCSRSNLETFLFRFDLLSPHLYDAGILVSC